MAGYFRVTETGDQRVVEAGTNPRVTEDYAFEFVGSVSSSGSVANYLSKTAYLDVDSSGSGGSILTATLTQPIIGPLVASSIIVGSLDVTKPIVSSLDAQGSMVSTTVVSKPISSSVASIGGITTYALVSKPIGATLSSSSSATTEATSYLVANSSYIASGSATATATSSLILNNVVMGVGSTLVAGDKIYNLSKDFIAEGSIDADGTSTLSASCSLAGVSSVYGKIEMVHLIDYGAGTFTRITEATDTRITEDGDTRVLGATPPAQGYIVATPTHIPFGDNISTKVAGSWQLTDVFVKWEAAWEFPVTYVKHNNIWQRIQ